MRIHVSPTAKRLSGALVLGAAVAFLIGVPYLVVLTAAGKALYFVAGVALLSFGALLVTSSRPAAPEVTGEPVRADDEYVVLPR